ncbi:MAG: TMEM165/GDT1 family protein [Thermoplasmata archaeon]
MEWHVVLALSFILVALAELGDKSQVMTISLASKYHYRPVFWGIFIGMGVVTVIGVAIGSVLYTIFPMFYIKIFAGLVFIAFGVISLYKEEKYRHEEIHHRKIFQRSFFLSFIAELGDKTQLAVIALTARYMQPAAVLSGSLIGLALVIAAGVFLGNRIARFVEREKIELIAALAFIILGIIFIIEPFLL